ncbi:hypothetical protein FHS43_002536 [Streptosporangium becharense]|uniref:Uncharacterized protein n=1 Tax=Streptosporangium becharense TaxID=1816182 RepID=A0A7W9IJD0_9ACTN|nr:hypothetical protein [Streptosporangium becharense]MBB2911271.1 hypothetical protein [Streptosporangium becharense]MBB5821671.1 hypothetical protein [Streptosporangium becharense]
MDPISSATGPSSPHFTGIDPDLMDGFVNALERGRGVIGEQSERIRRLLTSAEVSAVGLQPIKEIEGWVGDELPTLRKRLQTINQDLPLLGTGPGLPGKGPTSAGGGLLDPVRWGLLPYDEKTGKSPAGNARKGTELAFEFGRLPSSPLGLPTAAYDRILGKLADGQKDPYLTAGFFRIIGPEGMISMVTRLERYDKKAAEKHRKVIGNALATAVGAQPGLLGSAWKAGDIKKASGSELAILLRHGMFPTAWLTEIARSRVGKPVGGDGSRPRRWKTDLVPLLPALANSPDAARGLFNTMSREDLRDLFTELNRVETPELPFQRPAGMDFDAGAEFGRMLAAAGGAYEEGPHSPEAAKFAFNTMIIMGDLRDTDGTKDSPGTPMQVAPRARPFMAALAGAYAAEITEGANIGDSNMTEASTLKPFTSAFGTTAAFTLSPRDTLRFLKTFADSAKNLAPFDQGMGRFSQKLIADASAAARRTKDIDHLDRVFTALGNVRGFELAAVEKVQGNLDMIDKQQQDVVKFLRDASIGLTGTLFSPTLGVGFGWLALSTSLSAEDNFGKDDETRMDRVNKGDRTETLGRQHTYAQVLMANGFTPKVTPAEFQAAHPSDVAITDAKGNLKPFSELIKHGNRGLEAFEKWAVANGMGGDEEFLLGELSSRTALRFDGGNKRGRDRALAYDS